jgi:hypothetical protein
LNLYQFVGNNPVSRIDPFGLIPDMLAPPPARSRADMGSAASLVLGLILVAPDWISDKIGLTSFLGYSPSEIIAGQNPSIAYELQALRAQSQLARMEIEALEAETQVSRVASVVPCPSKVAKTPGEMWEEAMAQAQAAVDAADSDAAGFNFKFLDVNFDPAQVQSKFKHAADFGVLGNNNAVNRAAFQEALEEHIADPASQLIQGTYRGMPVTHIVNPSTGLNVIIDSSGNFVSGWKLNPTQLQNVINRGSL